MANISITVDTESKEVSVSVDGSKIDNVHDIRVFTESSGFFGVDISTLEEMDNLTKVTHLVANFNHNDVGEGCTAPVDSQYDDLYTYTENRLHKDAPPKSTKKKKDDKDKKKKDSEADLKSLIDICGELIK